MRPSRRTFATWLRFCLAGLAVLLSVPAAPTSGQGTRPSIQPLPGITEGDDRFGIGNIYPEEHWVRLAHGAGMRWNRWEFRWAAIEPRRGQLDLEGPDYIVDYNQRAGLKLQGVLISIPKWAEARTPEGGIVPSGLYEPWDSPANTWGVWVRTMAERYRGRVQAWEVWNEPDYPRGHFGFWFGSKADYYQLLKVAYRNIKAVDPQATVLLAGLMYWGDPYYLEQLIALAQADPEAPAHNYFFDAIAWHVYSRPIDAYTRVLRSRQLLYQTVGPKAIWINEGNLPVWPESRLNNYGRFPLSGTLEEQAAWVIQWYAYALAAGADRVLMYRMHDSDEPEAWGLARSDGSLRPAYVAYQLAARYFANSTRVIRAPLGDAEQIIFLQPERRVTVVWNATPRPLEVDVGASAPQAQRIALDGTTTTLVPQRGVYRLALPPATANTGLHPGDYLLGGAPYLLVEARAPVTARVEEDDSRLRWSGAWRRVALPPGSSAAASAEPGASVSVAFSGPTLTWYTSRGPWAGSARLQLDDRPLAEVDLYNPAPVPEAAYTFTDLGDGPHLLTLTVTGQRAAASLGAEVAVDAFVAEQVAPAPPLPPLPSPTLSAPLATITPLPSATPTASPISAPGTPARVPPAPTATPSTPTATPSPTATAVLPPLLPTAPPVGPLPGYTIERGVPPVYIVPPEPTPSPTVGPPAAPAPPRPRRP